MLGWLKRFWEGIFGRERESVGICDALKASELVKRIVLASSAPNDESNNESPAAVSSSGKKGDVDDKGVMVWLDVASFTLSLMESRRRNFLPVLCWTEYWHFTPLSAHLLHVGFSLEHLTLEAAQDSQLSRSFCWTRNMGRKQEVRVMV